MSPEEIQLTRTGSIIPQSNGADWEIKNMKFFDYDLFCCTAGVGTFFVNSQKTILRPGEALLICPGDTVSARNENPEILYEMTAQHFTYKIFNSTDFFSLVNFDKKIKFTNWADVSFYLKKLGNIEIRKNKHLLSSLFHTLLLEFLSDANLVYKSNDDEGLKHVIEIIAYIENNLEEQQLFDNIIEKSTYGYSYTYKLFKKTTGSSIKSFIIKKRLEKGKGLLLKGESVFSVANKCGYKDEYYFSRLFKRYVGYPPSEHLKKVATLII